MSLPASLFLVAVVNTYLERVLSSIPLPILMNTTFAFISACGTWFYWKIAVRQHLLVATAVLTVGVAFMSLVFLLSKSGLEFELVLLPLPFVMFAGIPWIVATRWSWERAGHTRHRPLMGLFMESLTMFLVVVPLTVIAILAVRVITDEPIWVAVAGIVIALLFSSAISEPFGKFLRALGGLDENRRGPDS